jgi:DNA topoisomerase-1
MGKTPAHEGLTPPPVTKKKRNRKKARKGRLVIVESPAKARTVGRYLGEGYKVKASIGHVRDLLRSQLSVDVDNDFQPKYRVPNEKREVVKELKAEAAKAEEVFLATDPDREGEAIAWHLLEAAEIEDDRARRVEFHEITSKAIKESFENPRSIDMNLVDAQQARRILDRLVGYSLSPLLWSKVRSRLSAGRVQSVALRMIVDREREIENFEPREYWTVDADFLHVEKPPQFTARLVKINGENPEFISEDAVGQIEASLRRADYHVDGVKRGQRKRKAPAPFTTSTMQQDASRRLGFTARKAMAVAQQLYEGLDLDSGEPTGLITYMRTDSTHVSQQAQQEARSYVRDQLSGEFLPDEAPVYKTKARGAQQAHEAIRPTSVQRTPESLSDRLSKDQGRLYELIWKRFVASQMMPATFNTLRVDIRGEAEPSEFRFRVTASGLAFAGFLEIYGDRKGSGQQRLIDESKLPEASLAKIPDLSEGDKLDLVSLQPDQHFTQPPPRYSDASLVKTMEEHGIGRPSTYAPTITTILRRGYVERDKRRLMATEIGMIVNDLMVEHFPNIVDLGFSAAMEEDLDEVELGKRQWEEIVREFYGPFSKDIDRAFEEMPEVKAEPELLGRDCPESGHPLLIRHGRFGRFIGCSDFPKCRYTEPWLEKIGVTCPEDGGEVVERRTRKGRVFYGCANYPECQFTSWKKPLPAPCPNCSGLLVRHNRLTAKCTECGTEYKMDDLPQPEADLA